MCLALALIGVTSIAALVFGPAAVQAQPFDTALVSASSTGDAGDSVSDQASVSADGRYIAFASMAFNLSDENDDSFASIYVKDSSNGQVSLISRADGATGEAANGVSIMPSISDDGRYVAFESEADNLSDLDDDSVSNIFVRDRVAGTTKLLSRATGAAGAGGEAGSYQPSISADGLYVAFESDANNLSASDNDAVRNIFVRHLSSNTLTLVSRANGASGAPANKSSNHASISADGRSIAFETDATDLAQGDVVGVIDVFVRDIFAGSTVLASRASGSAGNGGSNASFSPSISADGSKVAFASSAGNLTPPKPDTRTDIYVRDLSANTTELVDRTNGLDGSRANNSAGKPQISADGKQVAFLTNASNLDPRTGELFNVFIRDLEYGETRTASAASGIDGLPVDAAASSPAISADGKTVAFSSAANNLTSKAKSSISNVYSRYISVTRPVPPPRGGGEEPVVTPGVQTSKDTVAPKLIASLPGRFSLATLKKKGTNLTYRCDEDCALVAKVSFQPQPSKVGRKKRRLKPFITIKQVSALLKAGSGQIKLKFTKGEASKVLRSAGTSKAKVLGKIRVETVATDAHGNASAAKLSQVQLRRG